MSADAARPSAAHRAALALHALSGADRGWVLQSLTPQERGTLEPLLQELAQLGVPREAGLFDEVFMPAPVGAATAARRTGPLDELDAPAIDALAGMLRLEPPRLTAMLLAARHWPWRRRLLDRLGDELAAQVERMGAATLTAPALQEALVAEILGRLHSHRTAPAPGTTWRAWSRRLRAFGRRK